MAKLMFKVISVAASGLICVGVGALGTHLARPALEKKFFPERINKNKELQKTFDNSNETIKQQNKKIDELKGELLQKSHDLEEKNKEYSEQSGTIVGLKEEINNKEVYITHYKKQKEEIEKDLSDLNRRIALNKEDILTEKGLKMNLLEVDMKKIEFQSFSDNFATFKTLNLDGTEVNFKISKEKFTNHEEFVRKIISEGVKFRLSVDLNSWNKNISVCLYDVKYKALVNNEMIFKKPEEVINLAEYFRKEYQSLALMVFLIISEIDNFPIWYDGRFSSGDTFKFRDDLNIDSKFSQETELGWSSFMAKVNGNADDIVKFCTGTFKTKEDLIKYWINKTIDFAKMGKADFLDLLSPVLRSKSYQIPNN